MAREKKHPRDNDKSQRNFRIERTESLAGRARRTERALHSLEVVEKPWEGWDLRFAISEAARSGDVVVRLEEAVVERGDFTLGPFTLDIAWAERIALVGPNGSGKTTLVEALLGRLPLSAGTRRMGPSVVVGELAQDRRVLGDHPTLADAFTAATGLRRDQARSQLAKFGLGADAVLRPSSSLSPGERTRAELAAFAALGVNFLVLDEPTNHLDLPAIEQLESALQDYGGTLLLVSHDRHLLQAVTTTRRRAAPRTRRGVERPARELTAHAYADALRSSSRPSATGLRRSTRSGPAGPPRLPPRRTSRGRRPPVVSRPSRGTHPRPASGRGSTGPPGGRPSGAAWPPRR